MILLKLNIMVLFLQLKMLKMLLLGVSLQDILFFGLRQMMLKLLLKPLLWVRKTLKQKLLQLQLQTQLNTSIFKAGGAVALPAFLFYMEGSEIIV